MPAPLAPISQVPAPLAPVPQVPAPLVPVPQVPAPLVPGQRRAADYPARAGATRVSSGNSRSYSFFTTA